ncbi:hypothetical protein GCM10017576_18150 [Microbacterium barkeri]|uniref:Uncharacterized protein n=1 Tax=Microbacterium barkeri TaxID=33917 RepID=A0A9W6H3U1_9MICO|nr:hypothetical protein [Microbacterium barkeri]MDR6875465.1 hypothetical protein [Microbacterium barkeri]GLJ61685.1 hypothetical protein GCM10017576_18150 [Microbacterium barkeri]
MPDPFLPEDITARDLAPAARNELKTLSKENAERVARHLAMASRLIDEDPQLAHEHALAAVRHAGRIGVARETLAITAYANGDFALALRELRTQRRITGRNDNVALIVDSERGVGRPEKALEEGRAADREALDVAARVELAIAMSGARLDLGQTELALHELDIPELDPDRAFEWSPGLFAARANVLEDLGRTDEAASWRRRAEVAEEALLAHRGADEDDFIFVDDTDTEALPAEEEHAADDVASEQESASEQEPAAAPEPAEEPEPEPAEEPEPEQEFTIEDEVSEILIAAGIEGAADATPDDAAAAEPDATPVDTEDAESEARGEQQPAPEESTTEDDRPDGALF